MIESDEHPLTPELDVVESPAGQDPADRRDPDEDDRVDTPGGNDQEEVEDRPNVGIVEPEDYPEQQ